MGLEPREQEPRLGRSRARGQDAGAGAILVEPSAKRVAHDLAIRLGHEPIEVAVREHDHAVLVRRLFGYAARRLDAVLDEELEHAREIMVAADARHPREMAGDFRVTRR